MTVEARDVLHHAELAVEELKKADFNETKIWRLRWMTAVVLLRAVLHIHINYNESLKRDEEYQKFWALKKDENIFKNFIEPERNVLLKEFDFERVAKTNFVLTTENGKRLITEDNKKIVTEDVFLFKGLNKPVDELLDEAIVWLNNYLDEVERRFFK